MNHPITMILTNGKIYTMDGQVADSIAIAKDKIFAVGDCSTILALKETTTQVIDLNGNCVLPGFIDSHMHMLITGIQENQLDLRDVTSAEEIVKRGKEYIKKYKIPSGTWIVGFGFNQNLFSDKAFPTKELLNQISTEHPILIKRVCTHVGTVNDKALELLSIDATTTIEGGEIDKDKFGNPNGILRESALFTYASRIPMPSSSELEEILHKTCHKFNQIGLTTVHSNDISTNQFQPILDLFQKLAQEDKLTVRILEQYSPESKQHLIDFLQNATLKTSDFFKIENIKLFADGSLGAATAYMSEPYADHPGTKGICVYSDKDMASLVAIANNTAYPLAIHTIGDGALEQALLSFELIKESDPLIQEKRHRIVHCQIASDLQLKRMAMLGLCADIQPAFVPTDTAIVTKRLGEKRSEIGYRWKTMQDLGICISGSSDSPVESYDPLYGIYCAITRKFPGADKTEYLPKECLSRFDAVALYTKKAAYIAKEESIKGTLTANKYADLVVLSEDIFEVEVEEIPKIKVLYTLVNGKIVYEAVS